MFVIKVRDQINSLATELDLDPITVRYIHSRYHREGISFLTKTLPKLAKSVLRSLELGYFDRPTDFRWQERSLRHFRSLLDKIFDHVTGQTLAEPCALAIYSLRTLCEYFYKLTLPFKEEVLQKAEEEFITEDQSLERSSFDWNLIETLRRDFENHHRYSKASYVDVFKHRRPFLTPGTYSGRTKDIYYIHKSKPIKVPTAYRACSGYFKPYPSAPVSLEVGADTARFSEVLFVPKDSRGPRTIVREPMGGLAAQMSFHVWLRDHLERVSLRRVNFVNQEVNRDLAKTSSISREFCTLDLKSASDRVSFDVISHITRNSPAFRYFLKRRTKIAVLPSGRTLTLKKIAGMGSGLTFPTMSLLIYLTCCRAITDQRISYKESMRLVYVYGDDIIVPTKYAMHVRDYLSRVGLKVNSEKSYTASLFRESCGADYFNGQDVGPLRLKLSNCDTTITPKKNLLIRGSAGLLQLERHARECVKHGFNRLAEVYYRAIERSYGKLPVVGGNSSVIGRYSLIATDAFPTDEYGMYPKLRALVPVPVKTDLLDMDPYVYLGSNVLSGDCILDPLRHMDNPFGSKYGEITVPRSVRYKRTKVSALDLIV